jgi:hypothetical protein
MTRNPLSGSFEGAASLARALRQLVTRRTAVVATGDLVHYGRGYDVEERVRAMQTDVGGSPRLLRKRGRGDASPRPGGP